MSIEEFVREIGNYISFGDSTVQLFDFVVRNKDLLLDGQLSWMCEVLKELLRKYYLDDNWHGALEYHRLIFGGELFGFYAVHL
jgi:hypothetical protein